MSMVPLSLIQRLSVLCIIDVAIPSQIVVCISSNNLLLASLALRRETGCATVNSTTLNVNSQTP